MKATARGKLTRDDQLSCSQLPAVMGESPYQTANDVLTRCCAAIVGKPADDIEQNESMGWGSRLELPILEEAAARLGLTLEHGFDHAFQAKGLPLACSLDGVLWLPSPDPVVIRTDPDRGIYVMTDDGTYIVMNSGIAEAKLTASAPEDSPPLHRGPLQLQGQMLCTDTTWGIVATLHRGTELRIHLYPAHEGTQEAIRKAAWDFQARLDTFGQTGHIDHYPLQSPDDGSRTYPDARPITIDLPDAEELAQQIAEGKGMAAQGERMVAEATTRLMDMMGEAEQANAGRYVVTWGSRSYKAQPAKTVPAKDAYTIRSKTLTVKEQA